MENLNVQGLLKSISTGANLVYVVTDNERRTEAIAAQAAARLKGADLPYVWNCTEGMTRGGVGIPDTVEPLRALDFAIAQPGPSVLVFKDLSWFWRDSPFIIRKLKEFASRAKSKVLIILGQGEEVPEGLREDITILYQGLPTVEEIRTYLEQLVDREPLLKKAAGENPELVRALVLAAQGLDLVDIERGVRTLRASPEAGGDEIVNSLFETKGLSSKKAASWNSS